MTDLLKQRLADRQPPAAHFNIPPKGRWKILRAWSGEPPDPEAHLTWFQRARLMVIEAIIIILYMSVFGALWITTQWFRHHPGAHFNDFLAALH
jgi:hypothetical protein